MHCRQSLDRMTDSPPNGLRSSRKSMQVLLTASNTHTSRFRVVPVAYQVVVTEVPFVVIKQVQGGAHAVTEVPFVVIKQGAPTLYYSSVVCLSSDPVIELFSRHAVQ